MPLRRALATAGLIIVLAPVAGPSGARAQGYCSDLWYARNSIYKAAGYCFRTARGIRTFGNAGCLHDSEYDLPLSASQRAEINRIVQAERAQGCR